MNDDKDIHNQVRKLLNSSKPADFGVAGRTSKDEEIALRINALSVEQADINACIYEMQNRIIELQARVAELTYQKAFESGYVNDVPVKVLTGWRRWLYILIGF